MLRTLKNLAIEEQLKAMKLKNNNLKLQIKILRLQFSIVGTSQSNFFNSQLAQYLNLKERAPYQGLPQETSLCLADS